VRGLVWLVLIVFAGAACSATHHGSSPTPTTRQSPSEVVISFTPAATRHQADAVSRRLESDARVKSFSYHFANDVYTITHNEFSGSGSVISPPEPESVGPLRVLLVSPTDFDALVRQYRGMPGVDAISPAPGA